MGFFDKLLGDKQQSESVTPVQIHPDGLQFHKKHIIRWLQGAVVFAINPATGGMEKVDNPIFDPSIVYVTQFSMSHQTQAPSLSAAQAEELLGQSVQPRVEVREVTKTVAIPTPQQRTQTVSPAVAQPYAKFNRGDVWQSRDGRRFLVIFDKSTQTGYNRNVDSEGSLVCVRYDEGMKKSLTNRTTDGSYLRGMDGDLVRKVDYVNLPAIDIVNGALVLFRRKKDKLVAVPSNNYEAKVRS